MTVSVVSERQPASAALRVCITAISPSGAFNRRTVASARRLIGQGDVQDAGVGAEGGQRLRRPQDVGQRPADDSAAVGVAASTMPCALVKRKRRPAADRPSRQRVRQCFMWGLPLARAASADVSSARRQGRRQRPALPPVVEGLPRWSITCTPAPTQMVARKAMISTGTARRSSGSAVNSRRYAGLAIDCASPLMESERTDALATSARAMKASVRNFPCHPDRKDVPHRFPNQFRLESMSADLSRVLERNI